MYTEICNSTFAQETSSEEMTWKTGIEVRITNICILQRSNVQMSEQTDLALDMA
jgi:hypothetical protein